MTEFEVYDDFVNLRNERLNINDFVTNEYTPGMNCHININTTNWDFCKDFLSRFERFGTVNVTFNKYCTNLEILKHVNCYLLGVIVPEGGEEKQISELTEFKSCKHLVLLWTKNQDVSEHISKLNLKTQSGTTYAHYNEYMIF